MAHGARVAHIPKILDTNQIQSSYRITLTSKVREKLKVGVGDVIAYVEDGRGNILLKRVKKVEVRI